VIIDLARFVSTEQPFWNELDGILRRLEEEHAAGMTVEQLRRFHYLYERASADLARIGTFAAEPELGRHLESLVARAYAEIHETRRKELRWRPVAWFFRTFPQVFRRRIAAFYFSVAVTIAGCAFGALALEFDSTAKSVIMPFSHLQGDPSKRVAREESADNDQLNGRKGTFSAALMTHNTQVSILTMALGMTWGVGTIIMLFYNGVILGAVCLDYIRAGQTPFLAGWLLPHGSFEIPAILIAGQAGLILGRALIGTGARQSVALRLRAVGPDLVTLIGGAATLLVWAGFVESFFSQYHEPVLPYWFKIAFGCVELLLLTLFLSRAGRTGRGERA
jgi:uncharacterized membrane protein SpoIIM required for sporulation